MDLSGNLLTGSIPAPSTALTKSISDALLVGLTETVAMRRLSLASNLLDGTIPVGLWRHRLQACLCYKTAIGQANLFPVLCR